MSSTSLSMTAAAAWLRSWSRSAFCANGDKFPEELAGDVLGALEHGLVFLDTIFKFTDASRSWVIGLSFLKVGVLLSRTCVTDQVTQCGGRVGATRHEEDEKVLDLLVVNLREAHQHAWVWRPDRSLLVLRKRGPS